MYHYSLPSGEPLSPAETTALELELERQRRQDGSPSAPHFASRRRIHNPTPFETQRMLAAVFPPNKRVPVSQTELNRQTKMAIHLERASRHREEEIQRRIRKNRALATLAKAEWLALWRAFNGSVTQVQYDAWHSKYSKIYIPGGCWDWPGVTIIPLSPLPPGTPLPGAWGDDERFKPRLGPKLLGKRGRR